MGPINFAYEPHREPRLAGTLKELKKKKSNNHPDFPEGTDTAFQKTGALSRYLSTERKRKLGLEVGRGGSLKPSGASAETTLRAKWKGKERQDECMQIGRAHV